MNTIANLTARPLSLGVGFVNFRNAHDDVRTKKEAKAEHKPQVTLWSGQVMVPQLGRVAVFMKGIDRLGHYECEVKQPPSGEETETEGQAWPVLGTFTLPYFNGADYVEGTMPVGSRKYQVRMIRNTEAGWVMLRLPQVVRGSQDVAKYAR